ncbi:MAG: DUF3943 domain-containing protein [Gemmatimonadota bacterium]
MFGDQDDAAAVTDTKWSLVQSGEARSERRFLSTGALAQGDARSAARTPHSREFGDRRSYLVPALEIFGFDVIVNRTNNLFGRTGDYHVTTDTVRRNFRGGWVTDNDPFSVNQFAHPYQGAMYHGFARSAGLGYWESSAYTFLGSALWEIAGERTRPSINDQVASGLAGSLLGEPLFRMASLVLEHGNGAPSWMREIFAGVISPPLGLNRLAFGDRFAPVFSSRGAAYYSRLQLGYSGSMRRVQGTPGTEGDFKRNALIADFSMQYGLPGKPGYEYTRPFDYFTFDITATTANMIDTIGTRGLMAGKPFGEGDDAFRGIWGLYGSYDYIAPQTYRISTTALSLGTTMQWWLARGLALQASALAGVGYGAVGALHVTTDKDYHYGVAPQAVLLLRLIFKDKAALDLNARDFFVHGISRGNENIARADVSFTWRVYKNHALALKYLWNRRDSSLPILGSRAQTGATLGVFYSYVGREGFSAVDWR